MKYLFTALLLVAFGTSSVQAQSRVHAEDLIGTTWKLNLNVDLEEQKKDAEGLFARAILGAVDGFMGGIDIRFELLDDGEMRILTEVMDESDVEYSTWSVDDEGRLLLGESDKFSSDDDTVWLMDNGRFIAYNLDGDRLTRNDELSLEQIK